MSLRNLQAEFKDLLLANDSKTSLIHPSKQISIYHHNMLQTLKNSLQETYPLLLQLLGNDCFLMTANDYIIRYPSTNGDLHTYGEYFSDFIATYSPLSHLNYLSEVALFEWYCHIAYFAADCARLDIKTLQTIQPENYPQLHFSLHPSATLLRFRYPILEIVDLCQQKIAGPLNIEKSNLHLLIARPEKDIALITLSEVDFVFLTALQADLSLQEALLEALEMDPHFNLDEKLIKWVQNKIIIQANLTDAIN